MGEASDPREGPPEGPRDGAPVAARAAQAKVARRLRAQGAGCAAFGSTLYGHLLAAAADDVDRGGPVWELLAPHGADPGGSALALRLMGATHRLALSGVAPDLAAHYPSTGGDGDLGAAWDAWLALVRDRPAEVAPHLARAVQTNEVGRVGALLGGFLAVARSTGMPLRVLEVGSSAGLNLRWDQFRIRCGPVTWGPAGSPVDLGDPFDGAVAPLLSPASVTVAERRGCDVNPLDPTSDDGRLTLLSFVWPDQTRRFANLAAACDLARSVPATVDHASGDSWLAEQLSQARPGLATVVFHSVMLQYMTPPVRNRFLATIQEAGAAATVDAPLAWLHLEPRDTLASDMVVRLAQWPARPARLASDGTGEQLLGVSHPHGAWVRWGDVAEIRA
jgi:hypothetical protein